MAKSDDSSKAPVLRPQYVDMYRVHLNDFEVRYHAIEKGLVYDSS